MTFLSTGKDANFGGIPKKIILGVNNLCTNIRVYLDLLGFRVRLGFRVSVRVIGIGLVSGSSLVGVCRHLAAVMWSTYTTVVYSMVVSIVDLRSIHDGRVRSMQARRSYA